jgi:hypothetical protein
MRYENHAGPLQRKSALGSNSVLYMLFHAPKSQRSTRKRDSFVLALSGYSGERNVRRSLLRTFAEQFHDVAGVFDGFFRAHRVQVDRDVLRRGVDLPAELRFELDDGQALMNCPQR